MSPSFEFGPVRIYAGEKNGKYPDGNQVIVQGADSRAVFDSPQVFCANGMPVESFVPCADTLPHIPADVQSELRTLFPDLGPEFAEYPTPSYKARKRVSYTPSYV